MGVETVQHRVPPYLKSYVVEQDYARYTPREQATWRLIMRNSREYISSCAHPVYLEGLRKTGVPIQEIPRVEDIDRVLSEIGWGAVCVRGFIPPLAFLDFQARKILPIAADMRTLEHVCYTPAPDIVHEAAGHAPILADPEYARYITRYATLARKAIFSTEDLRLYEAIRKLSDVKENPDCSSEEIAEAQAGLDAANRGITWLSEAALVARMNWWTAEYGLVGDVGSPRIFGAGLLSSLGESRSCLEEKVRKIPLSLACLEQSYDITEPQPQLFVAKDFAHLLEVLESLEKTMSFVRGGTYGLGVAQNSGSLTTTVFDSGVSVSGELETYEEKEGHVAFLKWRGPAQLCDHEKELPSQGRRQHPEGFSSPVGAWKGVEGCPDQLSDMALEEQGLHRGQKGKVVFASGVVVSGVVQDWQRSSVSGALLVISWRDATVQWGDRCLFQPEWGTFDMLVGSSVTSVYGGPGDWLSYGSFALGEASSTPGRKQPYSEAEKSIFALYQHIRTLRQTQISLSPALVEELMGEVLEQFPEEWLLSLEVLELLIQHGSESQGGYAAERERLKARLEQVASHHPDLSLLLSQSVAIAAKPD